MVTKAQIDRLSQRINLVAERLGAAKRPTSGFALSFSGETDEEFYARYPDARGPDGRRRRADIILWWVDVPAR